MGSDRLLYIYYLYVLASGVHEASGNFSALEHEAALQHYLLENYTFYKNIVPLQEIGVPLEVFLSMGITTLVDFDQREEILTTISYLMTSWRDPGLTWKPETYGNVTRVFLKQKEIWLPDLTLLNTVDDRQVIGHDDLYVSVLSDGHVHWFPPNKYRTTCAIDITYFPFDSQVCKIELATWMHTVDKVVVMVDAGNISIAHLTPNGQWTITETAGEYRVDEYGENHATFAYTLRRRRVYYVIVAFVPVAFLSVSNCFVYLLPCESGERMSFAVTLFLSYVVFLSFVSDNLPRSSTSTSIFVLYMAAMHALGFLSVLSSVCIIGIKYRLSLSEHPYTSSRHRDVESGEETRVNKEEEAKTMIQQQKQQHEFEVATSRPEGDGGRGRVWSVCNICVKYLDYVLFVITVLHTVGGGMVVLYILLNHDA